LAEEGGGDGGGIQEGALVEKDQMCEATALYFIDTHFGDMDPMPPSSKH
jgi:hypothetical protein